MNGCWLPSCPIHPSFANGADSSAARGPAPLPLEAPEGDVAPLDDWLSFEGHPRSTSEVTTAAVARRIMRLFYIGRAQRTSAGGSRKKTYAAIAAHTSTKPSATNATARSELGRCDGKGNG